MTWETALLLALRFGVPWVDGLLKIIAEHGEPTPEAWSKVMAMAAKPLSEYLREAEERAKAASPAVPPESSP